MSHPRCRTLFALVLALPTLIAGCDSKRPSAASNKGQATATPEPNVLAPLDTQPDLGHCRQALQALDGQDGAASRPALTEAEKADLTSLLKLTPAESAATGQAMFTPADAAYLEECLFLRAGVRSLRIDARPPLE